MRLRETRDGVYGLLRLKWEVYCFLLRSQITDNIFTQDTFRGEKRTLCACLTISISICLCVYMCVCVWVRTECYSELHWECLLNCISIDRWTPLPLGTVTYSDTLYKRSYRINFSEDFLWTGGFSVKCNHEVLKTDW